MGIEDTLISWYNKNKRPLPWRNTKNPYPIWILEIILQQTRVDQGTPYFEKFINKYPTIRDLAKASEDDILHMWQGLGYYSRARNLHYSAKYVINELNGIFPNNYKDLLKLKGVGEYTAAAIASFCFKEKVAAIDGNVYRVITRLFDIDKPVDKSEGKKEVKAICNDLIPDHAPDDFNQAIMDFGATVCTPKVPKCNNCPLKTNCIAKNKNTHLKRPVKSISIKQKQRYFAYIILFDNKHILINKRSENDIWKELYEFPLIEFEEPFNMQEIEEHKKFKGIVATENITDLKIVEYKPHILSHQKINSTFILLHSNKLHNNTYTKVLKSKLENYAFPILITNFINAHLNLNI